MKLFENLAERNGTELEHIRLIYGTKEYRHDQPEAKKKFKDIGIEHLDIIAVVIRLPGGMDSFCWFYLNILWNNAKSIIMEKDHDITK